MASNSALPKRKRRGPYLQYLQMGNPLTAMPQRTRLRYRERMDQPLRKFFFKISVSGIVMSATRKRLFLGILKRILGFNLEIKINLPQFKAVKQLYVFPITVLSL